MTLLTWSNAGILHLMSAHACYLGALVHQTRINLLVGRVSLPCVEREPSAASDSPKSASQSFSSHVTCLACDYPRNACSNLPKRSSTRHLPSAFCPCANAYFLEIALLHVCPRALIRFPPRVPSLHQPCQEIKHRTSQSLIQHSLDRCN